ncbi:4-hydroxybenzoate octaprenyltransferase [Thorsellia anophelis]
MSQLPLKIKGYWRLMRFDKPIGTLLLLWPTYWALCLATKGEVPKALFIIFTLGTIIMRAAGCVINDYADRHVDGHVERTKHRPLITGDVSVLGAKILFVCLLILALLLVLQLNSFTIMLSFVALLLASFYPFMKRYTHFPQVVLGAAFSWGMMMAYGAIYGRLPLEAWFLFAANLSWTVAYDTQYAMVDREDDLKIGVKSTAIFFGQYDVLAITVLQMISILMLLIVGGLTHLGWIFCCALALVSCLFIYQYQLIKTKERDKCFAAFRHNNWVGVVVFAGIAIDLYFQ